MPENDDKLVAVFGAESTQGFNVALSLLEAGFKVKAAVGDPKSDNSTSLQTHGANIVAATLAENSAVRSVLRGATHVWALSGLWCAPSLPDISSSTAVLQCMGQLCPHCHSLDQACNLS